MVMLPCNVVYDSETNRSYIYTKNMIEMKDLAGELLFLDVPNDVTHFKLCTDYFPLNFFQYKLKEIEDGDKEVYIVEYGEDPLVSKEGKMVILNGTYQFFLREVSPSQNTVLYKLLLDNFLHSGKEHWYPDDASILVMIPAMIEDAPAEMWNSVGTPLAPPKSPSIGDVDAWIVRAIERDGSLGLDVSIENAFSKAKDQ